MPSTAAGATLPWSAQTGRTPRYGGPSFGDWSRFLRFLGGYLAVYTVPDHLQLRGWMLAP